MDRRGFIQSVVLGGWMIAPLVRSGHAQPAASDAAAPILKLNEALLAVMKAGQRTPFQQRFRMLTPVIDEIFDLSSVLQLSIGPRWSSLTPDEQARLMTAFQRYTVANYVANFDSFSGQTFRVDPQIRNLPNGDRIVQTAIVSASGEFHALNYVMRRTVAGSGAGWRAVDVLAEGSISRVAVQRSDFRTILATGGGAALVSTLERKVADLSRGALA